MRLILITHSKTKDVWATIHKGKNEQGDHEFVAAFLNGVQMKKTWKAGSKKKIFRFNKKQMQKDFDNHPGKGVRGAKPQAAAGVGEMRLIRNAQYCLPYRDPFSGQIVYACGGVGSYSC